MPPQNWLGSSEPLFPNDKWSHRGVNTLGKAHESQSVLVFWISLHCRRGYRRGAAVSLWASRQSARRAARLVHKPPRHGEALPPARLPLQRSSTSCTTLHLCRLFQLGQQHPVGLIGRLVIDALMRTPLVVPVQVVADLLLHCSAGVSVFVHMLVFHAEPQPLDKPVVTPRSSPVHAQLGS